MGRKEEEEKKSIEKGREKEVLSTNLGRTRARKFRILVK